MLRKLYVLAFFLSVLVLPLTTHAGSNDTLNALNNQLSDIVQKPIILNDQQKKALYEQLVANCQEAQIGTQTPGLVIGMISNGSLLYWQGFGQRALNDSNQPDLDTVFPIGRLTQAFTANLAAMSVDHRYFNWDSLLYRSFPPFKWNTAIDYQTVTVKEILGNSSGLMANAGVAQSLFGPTKQDLILSIPQLTQQVPLNIIYQPQLEAYLLVGKLLERHGERPWEKILQEDLLRYLSMFRTTTSLDDFIDTVDRIGLHQWQNGTLTQLPDNWPYSYIPYEYNSALGMNSTLRNLSNFIIMQLANGLFANRQIISQANLQATLTPNITVSDETQTWSCLGWFKHTYKNQDIYYQFDNSVGSQAIMAFTPASNCGVIIMTNSSTPLMVKDLALDFMKQVIDNKPAPLSKDKLATWRSDTVNTTPSFESVPLINTDRYIGHYYNPVCGKIVISEQNGQLFAQLGYVNINYPLLSISQNKFQLNLPYVLQNLSGNVTFSHQLHDNYTQLDIEAFFSSGTSTFIRQ